MWTRLSTALPLAHSKSHTHRGSRNSGSVCSLPYCSPSQQGHSWCNTCTCDRVPVVQVSAWVCLTPAPGSDSSGKRIDIDNQYAYPARRVMIEYIDRTSSTPRVTISQPHPLIIFCLTPWMGNIACCSQLLVKAQHSIHHLEIIVYNLPALLLPVHMSV